MRSLNSLANHVGSLSTQAVEACAHRFHSNDLGFTGWHTSAQPAKFLFRYPSLFSARRGYPHSTFAASVNNGQAPFGFKFQNIGIRNHFGSQRINNFNLVDSQNKLGFNPNDKNKNAENGAQREISNDLNIVADNPKAIRCKERNQHVRSARPCEVTAGPKGFIHHPSIAGERK